jgi:hypothetical protein
MDQWTKPECAWCGVALRPGEWCQRCIEDFASRPDSHSMTDEQRLIELKSLVTGNGQFLMVPFGTLLARVDNLMQRPVFDIEMARPDSLIAELEGSRTYPGVINSLQEIVGDKPMLVVEV